MAAAAASGEDERGKERWRRGMDRVAPWPRGGRGIGGEEDTGLVGESSTMGAVNVFFTQGAGDAHTTRTLPS